MSAGAYEQARRFGVQRTAARILDEDRDALRACVSEADRAQSAVSADETPERDPYDLERSPRGAYDDRR